VEESEDTFMKEADDEPVVATEDITPVPVELETMEDPLGPIISAASADLTVPHTEYTVKRLYRDFGSEAECEPLGDAVSGPARMPPLLDFETPNKFAKKPSESRRSFVPIESSPHPSLRLR
jgi:hypothetical protein